MRWLFGLIDYRSGDVTGRCVASIRDHFPEADIVVVDNYGDFASTESVDVVIRPGRNTGFAGGVNLILNHARQGDSDVLWILNNDCILIDGARRLVESAMKGVEADVYTTTTLLGDTSRIWFGGGRSDPVTLRQEHIRYNELYAEPPDQDAWEYTQWASGANLILPKKTFLSCSMFDEDLFLYLEELDWQRRERSTVVCLLTAAVRHYAGSTTGSAHSELETFFTARNTLRIGLKQPSWLGRGRLLAAWALRFVVKPGIRGRRGAVRAALIGYRARKLNGSDALSHFILEVRDSAEVGEG